MSTKEISFINLKGGVAKTTTTVGTALALASHYKKKVLVIDLDPQTNATVMLIGEKNWKYLDSQNQTLYNMFKDILDEEHLFSAKNSIQKNVGNIKGLAGVDLLPSSISLVYIQDNLAYIRQKQDFSLNPHNILMDNLAYVKKDYDYILMDCPPNLGILSMNGIKMSNGYVIPAVPDILSTYGIPQIKNRIEKFASNNRLNIPCLGLVFTKVRQNYSIHKDKIRELKASSIVPIFDTMFFESSKYAEAAEYDPVPMTILQKWGYQGQFEKFIQFAGELTKTMEANNE